MKKRKLLIAAAVVLVIGVLPACDILEECGTCKLITEYGDGTKTEGTPLPLCGDALLERENALPVTVGDVTTYWECY